MVGFLPWIHSGLATYASFSVARMGRNLGVAGPFGVLCGAWAVVPLLAALVVMARVLGRDRLAGALALVLGLLAMTGALAVVFGATAAGVELSPAPIGAAGLGALVSFLAVTELRSAS